MKRLVSPSLIDSLQRVSMLSTYCMHHTHDDCIKLRTDEVPDECLENPYHKIAVTILACFCTDEKLVHSL